VALTKLGFFPPTDFRAGATLTPPSTFSVFLRGTTTPAQVYADENSTTALPNPLPTNVAPGSCGVDTLGNVSYYASMSNDYDNVANGTREKATLIVSRIDLVNMANGVVGTALGTAVRETVVLFEGAVAVNSIFQAGIPTNTARTITGVNLYCDIAPTAAAVFEIYVKGPSTGQALSAVRATLTVPLGIYSIAVTNLTVGQQAGDRLIFKCPTPSGIADVTAIVASDTAVIPASPPSPPTAVAVSTAGQANYAVSVNATPPTNTSGLSITRYAWQTSTGKSGTSANATLPFIVTGLDAMAQTIQLAAVTSAGQSAWSAASPSYTPVGTTNLLTTAQSMGQGWTVDTNATPAYDTTVIRSGSGSSGSLKVVASAAGYASVLTTGRYARATGVSKPLACWVHNDTAADYVGAIWEVYFADTGTGAYLDSSPVTDVTIPANSWQQIFATGSSAVAGIGGASAEVHFAAANAGNSAHFSEMSVG